jgi:hypothetical protein
MSSLAKAAEDLAKDGLIMKSYDSFFNDKSGFILTKNGKLKGAIRRPPKFPSTAKDLIDYENNVILSHMLIVLDFLQQAECGTCNL